MELDQAVRSAFAAGGPVEGIRFGVGRASTSHDWFGIDVALGSELLDIGRGIRRPLRQAERDEIQNLIGGRSGENPYANPLVGKLASLGQSESQVPAPGEAQFLTVCRAGWTFGAMQLLRVRVYRLAARRRWLAYQAGEEFTTAFNLGVDAAENWLREHLKIPELALDVTGTVPYLRTSGAGLEGAEQQRLDGRSVGLAAAIATVSAVLGLPIAAGLALTGEVTLEGGVGWVAGADHKLQAARDAGLARVVAPSGFAREAHLVASVDTLDCALAEVFGEQGLAQGLAGFRDAYQPAGLSAAEQQRQRILARQGRRILISLVTGTDPQATIRGGPQAGQVAVGSTLRCGEHTQPDEIHLLFQEGDQVIRGGNLEPTVVALEQLRSAPAVRPHELGGGNPSDFRQLARRIVPVVRDILVTRPVSPDDIIFLNTTAGTKQQGRLLEAELLRQRLDVVLLDAPAGGDVGQVFPVALYLDLASGDGES